MDTLPVRTSTRFWMIPLLSPLLTVVEVNTSTRAVVVAGDAVVVLGADGVVVLEVESPPNGSKPKPRSPPSGAAETMHKMGRRLSKSILKVLEKVKPLDLTRVAISDKVVAMPPQVYIS